MEHLETDVMRFMAILAFCLVAIFALVQSVPKSPRQPAAVPEPRAAKTDPPVPETEVVRAAEAASAPPEPEVLDVVEVAPRAREAAPVRRVELPAPLPQAVAVARADEPAPEAEVAAEPVDTPPVPEAAPPDVDEPAPRGFSLRFDSDAALVGLVERDEVALYAFARERVWRFMLVDGRPTFRSAQAPGQVHEMAPATVPRPVVDALRRSVVLPSGGVKWGVTLPAPTAAVLNRVLATADGGDLVIDADGYLHLEERT